jgi:HK97 family phage prohead protease
MKKKIKDFEVKFKEFNEEEGVASGYLSIFGNIDHAGDIVAKGAYKESLAEKDTIPFLFQHNSDLQIGVMSCKEDEVGLLVSCKYYLNTNLGREKYELAKANNEEGVSTGLSIGYRVKDRVWEEVDGQQVRILKTIKLHEGSMVTFPCNELATLTDVKSVEDITAKEIEDGLCDVDGISNSLAKKYANLILKDLREEDKDSDEPPTKDEAPIDQDEPAPEVEIVKDLVPDEVVTVKAEDAITEIKKMIDLQTIKQMMENLK